MITGESLEGYGPYEQAENYVNIPESEYSAYLKDARDTVRRQIQFSDNAFASEDLKEQYVQKLRPIIIRGLAQLGGTEAVSNYDENSITFFIEGLRQRVYGDGLKRRR